MPLDRIPLPHSPTILGYDEIMPLRVLITERTMKHGSLYVYGGRLHHPRYQGGA